MLEVPCFTCHGAGDVDDGYPARFEHGQRFRTARVEARLSQREAATIAGCSAADLSKFERGGLVFDSLQETALARAIGLVLP